MQNGVGFFNKINEQTTNHGKKGQKMEERSTRRSFCVVPRTISPLNTVAKIVTREASESKLASAERPILDTGWRIRTERRPILWMMLATAARLIGELPLALTEKVAGGGVKAGSALLAGVSASSLLRALYELSRPVYTLYDARTNATLAVAQTAFTSKNRNFVLNARDLQTGELLRAMVTKTGGVKVWYKQETFELPELHPWRETRAKGGGYLLTMSRARLNILQLGGRLRPLNIFHSRTFCAEEEEEVVARTSRKKGATKARERERVPMRLMALLLYFWEHNGAVSLLQVGGVLAALAPSWKTRVARMKIEKQQGERGPVLDPCAKLWDALLAGAEDSKKVLDLYRTGFGIKPNLVPNALHVLRDTLQLASYKQLQDFFAATAWQLGIDGVARVAEDFRRVTGCRLKIGVLFSTGNWIKTLSKIGDFFGKDAIEKLLLTSSLRDLVGRVFSADVMSGLWSVFTSRNEPPAEMQHQDSWLQRFLRKPPNNLPYGAYQDAVGREFPLSEDYINAMRAFDIRALRGVNVAEKAKQHWTKLLPKDHTPENHAWYRLLVGVDAPSAVTTTTEALKMFPSSLSEETDTAYEIIKDQGVATTFFGVGVFDREWSTKRRYEDAYRMVRNRTNWYEEWKAMQQLDRGAAQFALSCREAKARIVEEEEKQSISAERKSEFYRIFCTPLTAPSLPLVPVPSAAAIPPPGPIEEVD